MVGFTLGNVVPLSGENVGGSGPGNYTSIQYAIDNASDGDTLFVFDDSSPYKGVILVSKSLTIEGENKITTIIDSGGFVISVDYVTISGFTIQNSFEDLHIGGYGSIACYNIVDNNIFSNVSSGITVDYYDEDTKNWTEQRFNISSNKVIFYTDGDGIDIVRGQKNIIIGNDVSQDNNYRDQDYASNGISVFGAFNNISYNNIHDNAIGITLIESKRTEVFRNTIKGNYIFGMLIDNLSLDRVILWRKNRRYIIK